jgi:DNA-binding XRE family transcriptional regulator
LHTNSSRFSNETSYQRYDIENAAMDQQESYHGYEMNAVQCKMARVALGWGTRELALNANVSPDTIARLERGEQLKNSTIAAIRAVFEVAGIEFIPENGGGVGVRLARRSNDV